MSTGAAVMFGFGIVWFLLGLFRRRPSPAWLRLFLLFVGIALGAAIVALATRASHIPPSTAHVTPQQATTIRDSGRRFYLIFAIELAAIFLLVIVLNSIHRPQFILSGIALIVGLHFLPLASLFNTPLYYGTGLLGCTIGLVGFFIADVDRRQKVVGLSFGTVLWLTAACILWLGFSAAPPVLTSLPNG
jgi:hypothetical protein